MQLVHNPHMPDYRWHLTCLTNNGVTRQFSTHLFQPVEPKSPPKLFQKSRVLFGGGGGIEAPSSPVFNSYHQIALYL